MKYILIRMRKLSSLATIAVGGATLFCGIFLIFYNFNIFKIYSLQGYNLYIGDHKFYKIIVIPFIHWVWTPERSHWIAVKWAKFGLVPRVPPDGAETQQYLVCFCWR